MVPYNAKTLETLGKVAELPPPPEPVFGDPTKPATKEELEYWKKQNQWVEGVCELYLDDDSKKAIAKEETEIFSYPSDDGSYAIESRYFRAHPLPDGSKPPLIVHFHGGGMTLLNRDIDFELNTCRHLRKLGCSVLTPEFRNARDHPFPAGVDDCLSTVLWASENRELLGYNGTIITSGASGGGNLSIATFVRAIEKGLPAEALIQGIFSTCPCIRHKYVGVERVEAVEHAAWPPAMLQKLSNIYTQSSKDAANPSAWPLLASNELLKRFPPVLLAGNEYDGLREDAKEMHERLIEVGVAGCRYMEYKNTIHAAEFMPNMSDAKDTFLAISAIANFAKDVSKMNEMESATVERPGAATTKPSLATATAMPAKATQCH
ncbi:MAG: hypothetical protein SGILL_009544 [Bacillariaceae sp.]